MCGRVVNVGEPPVDMNDDAYEYMDIYSAPGTKVVLWKPQNGWPHDKEQIERLGMKVGQEFTVQRTDVHSSSTTLYLKEFPNHKFNTVNFGVPAKPDELTSLRTQLAERDERLSRLEALVQDFQASGLIDVGNVGGPCCVEPRHIEAHVTELRQEIDAANEQLKAAKAALGVAREALYQIMKLNDQGVNDEYCIAEEAIAKMDVGRKKYTTCEQREGK
jgi:hypothetical protein